jgi:hypothetical protein
LSEASDASLGEEDQVAVPQDDEEEEKSVESSQPSRRGRPRIPISWSRVLLVTPELDHKGRKHEVFVDLTLQQNLIERQQYEGSQDWQLLFHPRAWAKEKDFEDLAQWQLSEDRLYKYAKMTSKLRAVLRERAIKFAEKEGQQFSASEAQVAKVVRLSSRGHYDQREIARLKLFKGLVQEETPSSLRKRTGRRKLTLDDKVQIAWKVLVGKERQADVARHFRMTEQGISRITSLLRKKPNLL